MSEQPHHRPIKKRLRTNAKRMRHSPTETETALWALLRNRRLAAYKFRRQFPVENYIVDFICLERRLIVEADGSQHLDSRKDSERDRFLAGQHFRIVRYWNNDIVQQPESVLQDLLARLQQR